MAKQINPMLAIGGGLLAVLLLFAIIAIVFWPGPPAPEAIEAASGDTVFVRYSGYLDTGYIFDSNVGPNSSRSPFKVVLGEHGTIRGFEDALYGMHVGESKTVRLSPEEAYPYDPTRVIEFNRTQVVDSLGHVPQIGDSITYVTGINEAEGIVKEVTETSVIVDFNSEIAGQYLTFEITVVEIQKGSGGTHH